MDRSQTGNIYYDYLPFLVSTTKPGQNHLSEAAGPVKFGLTFCPLDGTLQPSIEKALKIKKNKQKKNRRKISYGFTVGSLQRS